MPKNEILSELLKINGVFRWTKYSVLNSFEVFIEERKSPDWKVVPEVYSGRRFSWLYTVKNFGVPSDTAVFAILNEFGFRFRYDNQLISIRWTRE